MLPCGGSAAWIKSSKNAEMFEASGDLHFARDALEGSEFVLQLVMEKLPSEVAVAAPRAVIVCDGTACR